MDNKFPSLEEIQNDYSELLAIIGKATTINELKHLNKKFTIEVNSMSLDDFISSDGSNEEISFIRYETYKSLEYIYVILEKDNKIKNIFFDVWSDFLDDCFIENTTIKTLPADYNDAICFAKKMFPDNFFKEEDNELSDKDIISNMRDELERAYDLLKNNEEAVNSMLISDIELSLDRSAELLQKL